MASIQKIKNREGTVYVYLCDSWWENGKHKTALVKSFGRYEKLIKDNPNAYDELREKAKRGEIPYKSKRKQIIVKINLEEDISEIGLQNYGHLILERFYKELNIDKEIANFQRDKKYKYDLNEIMKLLVFQRILDPASKLKAVSMQRKMFSDWDFSQSDISRSLDRIHLLKDSLEDRLHKEITKNKGRTGYLVFYDVTNYYFEIDIEDAGEKRKVKRKRGVSKEKRLSPIIQMGLFMDSNGIPISYKLFSGNETDPITYKPAMEELKKKVCF
jgi:transposase